jgi:hypothetical protein
MMNLPVSRRLALAGAAWLVLGAVPYTPPVAAQADAQRATAAPAPPAKKPVTPDMLRRVGAPPRPDAGLRIEVKPGLADADEKRARAARRGKSDRDGN